jgi:hypothetical protein
MLHKFPIFEYEDDDENDQEKQPQARLELSRTHQKMNTLLPHASIHCGSGFQPQFIFQKESCSVLAIISS